MGREDLRKGKTAAAPPVSQTAAAPAPMEKKATWAPAPVSQKSIQDRIGWNPNQAPAAPKAPAKPSGVSEPNRTLFVENLPGEATDTMLSMLFRQYPGFQEVRLIPGRAVAFVDYENEHQAGMAMQVFRASR